MTTDLDRQSHTACTEAIDPAGFWRCGFWLIFVVANLTVAFCCLLWFVPKRISDKDFTLEYATRGSIVVLTVAAIVLARWLWRIRNPMTDRGPLAVRLVVAVAWVEALLALGSILRIYIATLRY
jgi:hypothetical protein